MKSIGCSYYVLHWAWFVFRDSGDPKYRVPKMNPMVIPALELQQGSSTGSVGLKLAWKNAEIHGIKDSQFLDIE